MTMEKPCIYLGIKIQPGPIQRHKIENFSISNTVDSLKAEAEKKADVPSSSLELIHHGKILKNEATLEESGVKNGETVHVLKKKVKQPTPPPPTHTDAELQQIAESLRTLGCTPNAPGWTRAMQLLNDESAMAEIMEHVPLMAEECVTLSILHEIELLAALGANVQTMRRGADARPELPTALRHLTRLVHSQPVVPSSTDSAPTSGFVYSLEALSEDEDNEEEETEETERAAITHEDLAVALQAATEAVSSLNRRGPLGHEGLLRLLQTADSSRSSSASAATTTPATPAASSASGRSAPITAEMFSQAISQAMSQANHNSAPPIEQSASASSSQSPMEQPSEDYSVQLQRMHEMGLFNDALNVRALVISAGDVNAAINLVFSGVIND